MSFTGSMRSAGGNPYSLWTMILSAIGATPCVCRRLSRNGGKSVTISFLEGTSTMPSDDGACLDGGKYERRSAD